MRELKEEAERFERRRSNRGVGVRESKVESEIDGDGGQIGSGGRGWRIIEEGLTDGMGLASIGGAISGDERVVWGMPVTSGGLASNCAFTTKGVSIDILGMIFNGELADKGVSAANWGVTPGRELETNVVSIAKGRSSAHGGLIDKEGSIFSTGVNNCLLTEDNGWFIIEICSEIKFSSRTSSELWVLSIDWT